MNQNNRLEKIVIQMESIARLHFNEKVIVKYNDYIISDKRFLSSFRGFFEKDNTGSVLRILCDLLDEIISFLETNSNSPERKTVEDLLPAFLSGLICLNYTYRDNLVMYISIGRWIERIEQLMSFE